MDNQAADLEYFFDPVCPWSYITSRWVSEVRDQRNYNVIWRPISLYFVNDATDADWYDADYRRSHLTGLEGLRIAAEIEARQGNDGVDAFYTAAGDYIHRQRRLKDLKADSVGGWTAMLNSAGLDPKLASFAVDESHDAAIRASTELALTRTGHNVGTPILTFHPGAADENSFFGPVIATIPRGVEAVKLWDAIELIATTSGMAELKRSLRQHPNFS